jgi:hypothetical protein
MDAGLRRQVDDAVGLHHVEHGVDRGGVLDLGFDLDDRIGQQHAIHAAPDQAEDLQLGPLLQQMGDQVRAHETGRAGDEQRG